MKVCPVILSGGSGTRLWPVSRKGYPKQFTKLIGDNSLFQQAALRLSGAEFAAPMVLTMVLGPLMERALRQSLEISGGDATIFFTRPISATALAIAAAFALTSLLQVARSVKARDAEV